MSNYQSSYGQPGGYSQGSYQPRTQSGVAQGYSAYSTKPQNATSPNNNATSYGQSKGNYSYGQQASYDPYANKQPQNPASQYGGYSNPSQPSNTGGYQPQTSYKPTTSYTPSAQATNNYSYGTQSAASQQVNQPADNFKDLAKRGKDLFKQSISKSASTSEYDTVMTRLQSTGELFRDHEFQTNLRSLTGGDSKKSSKWSSIVWRRPEEFWGPDCAVFKGGIDPNDIKQGQLGDCYFLSTLSAIAETPSRITNLFPHSDANPHGCYMVKICDMGVWKEVVMDDYFPCKNAKGGPIFTRGNDHELWVLILEKAWAKMYGSYARIEAGLTREVLHDLTGGPTEYFLTQGGDDPKQIWDSILKGEQENFIMTAGSGDFFDGSDLLDSSGLVGSHAYSLLSAVSLQTPYGEKHLVKLRNPWGESEWQGDWSDESSLWTPELKQQVNLEDKNDGTFFMSFEDFCKYFSDVQICRVHDDYNYSHHKTHVDPNHAVYVRFTIEKAGHYYITINQKSKRFFQESDGYQYSDVFLIVGREDGDDFEYVQGIRRADREVWTDGDFRPGTYIAYVKVPWYDGQSHDVTISTYGIGHTEFDEVPKESFGSEFLEKVYTQKAIKSGALKTYADDGEPDVYKYAELTDDGFGYFFFWNQGLSVLDVDVYFKIMSGIKLRKPYRGKTFKITVAPGEKQIVLTKVNPYYEVKQVYSEIPTFQKNDEQLVVLAKEKGQKKQRKVKAGDKLVDIWCYIFQHSDGIFFYYENNTNEYVLDEEVKFKLQGLKIEEDPYNTSVKFVLPPGKTRSIKLKKTLNEFSIGFSTGYLVKQAH